MNFDINEGIIICNNSIKNQILKNTKKLINIKFYTLFEFINNLYFTYDEKTILYISKKYNINFDLAQEYLNNLIYVEDKYYNIKKLDFLVNLKNELIEKDLFIYNPNFKNFISNKNISIYNYSLTKFDKYLLRDIKYNYINLNNNIYNPKIYEFSNIDLEMDFVANSISKLLDQGINIDKIKLTNVDCSYINQINKVFSFYNLKTNKTKDISIISTIVGKTFINNIYLGINNALESISEYKNTDTYLKIINICNKYIWCTSLDDLKLLMEHELKYTYIENKKYNNCIEIVDLKDYYFTDEYVFLIGFNQGVIPHIIRDEDYINDNIKPDYMDTTLELNKIEKENIICIIKNIKNLIITYKLKTPFNVFYPSSLIGELGEIKKVNVDNNISYSVERDKYKLAKMLDKLIKFGEKNNNLSILNKNYDIPYNTYSSSFTSINKIKIIEYINSLKEFNLSYTSMDNYCRCAFRFYIEKILGLKDCETKFSVILGNIYHHVLELGISNDINIKDEVYNYLKNNEIELNPSNNFFIEQAIDNSNYLIEIIKEQHKYSKMKTLELEKNIKINIKNNINFIGFIDKIMSNVIDDSIHSVIIDYKTYIKVPSLKYSKYGIDLQLPTYMFLTRNSYKNIRFAGFYLQNILLDNKSDEDKKNSLKLIGYTNTDKNLLSELDYNYQESCVIDGIKLNKDGSFSQNSLKHMLDDKKIDDLIELTEDIIHKTIDNILDAKFDINPKYDNENIGCIFCKYKDICYMNESNFVRIEKEVI